MKTKEEDNDSGPDGRRAQGDRGDAEMVLITARDEEMVEWLRVVRATDLESIRFALAAFADATRPVSLRRAQQWVVRMMETELIDRARLTLQDGSAVWATQKATG